MVQVIYYSSGSGNTKRFAEKLGRDLVRIPVRESDPLPEATEPFVLMVPCYGDNTGRGAVPKRVIHFLNHAPNREKLIGVVAMGNRNFGALFAQAGQIVAQKCGVPVLYRAELAGTPSDVRNLNDLLTRL